MNMFLHEEYIKRHNLNFRWMGYPTRGNLVLKEPDRFKWILLDFQKIGPDYHPQDYRIDIIKPKRNRGESLGHKKRLIFKWDEFELWLKDFLSKAGKFKIVKNSTEKRLTLWEIFVYCNDGWISKWEFPYKKALYNTLNFDLPLEEREIKLNEMLDMVRLSYPGKFRPFEANVLHYKQDMWMENELQQSNDM